MTISIALLVCDTPAPQVGPYYPIFKAYLDASLPNNGVSFTLDPYDVVNYQQYPPDDKAYDAFLITGSAASAYENLEWINKLVSYVADLPIKRPKAKIFGICFGHQIVGRAFGGECVPNGGKWEVGITEVQLNEVGEAIFGKSTLNIQQMHRDHVPAVPSSMELIGSTSVAYNQGMILTVQGHPEFTKPIVSAIVTLRSASGIFDKALADDVARRADLPNDGVPVIGRVMWRILGVDAP